MKRIGLLGGTFNPPHAGHLHAARAAMRELSLDGLWFLPDARPPHKELPQGCPDAEDRVAMTRRLAQLLPGSGVCTIEQTLPQPSYTSRTLTALSKLYPETEFIFIVGSDMLLTMEHWHEPETIFAHACIAALAREDADCEKIREAARKLRQRFGARITLLHASVLEVSSTQMREALHRGESPEELPLEVLEYIRERGLYA